MAWRELSVEMDRAGAATVGALDPEVLVKLAPRLWVTLPGLRPPNRPNPDTDRPRQPVPVPG